MSANVTVSASVPSIVVHDTIPQSLKDSTFWNVNSSCYVVTTDFAKLASASISDSCYVRLIDSGMSQHLKPNRDNFIASTLRPITPIPINSTDGHVFFATGKGNVCVAFKRDKDTQDELVLHDVLYAPTMPISLISVSRLGVQG